MKNHSIAHSLKSSLEAVYPDIVQFREALHRKPELSWKEYKTTRSIESMLRKNGIENIRRPLETGLIVDFDHHPGAPYVLLRADIDALPIQDEKEVPYRSQNPGICHACGHDGHTSMVLGVALALQRSGVQLPHNLRLVFQPAEEPSESGAPRMIEAGVLINVKMVLGMHLEPRLSLGTLGLASGWVNMRSDRIDLSLSGPGGHSARPADTADLIWLASRIIQDSYAMIYRGVDLRDSPVILTFTEIHAGQGYNIIPKQLKMTGTLRFAEPQKQKLFLDRFNPYLKNLAHENNCELELHLKEGAPAIYNDPALMKAMLKHLEEGFWMTVSSNTDFRTPGGDDFSYYCQHVPGAMVRIGVRTETTRASLHEGKFDIPAESLKIGAAFFLQQLVSLSLE